MDIIERNYNKIRKYGKIKEFAFEIDIVNNTCECNHYSRNGIPCQHLFKYMIVKDIPFTLSWINKKYHLSQTSLQEEMIFPNDVVQQNIDLCIEKDDDEKYISRNIKQLLPYMHEDETVALKKALTIAKMKRDEENPKKKPGRKRTKGMISTYMKISTKCKNKERKNERPAPEEKKRKE